jgi:elongation factor P
MLDYNEIKPGKYIILDGQPYLVVEFNFVRMQQRRPVASTKIKNLTTGNVIEKTFQQSDKVEEAEIEMRPVKYLYSHKEEFWFCEADNPAIRFKLLESVVGDYVEMLKPNSIIDAIVFNNQVIKIKLPIKIELKIIEAPPATKGNTAQGGSKQVKLETGMIINVPLFINEGDILKINTETKEYIERVEKG